MELHCLLFHCCMLQFIEKMFHYPIYIIEYLSAGNVNLTNLTNLG